MEIVDTHIHVWTAEDPTYPMYIEPGKYPWWKGTTTEYIAEKEEAGIDRAVIVQIPYHRYDHSYALEARRRFPSVFAIVGLLDVHDVEATTEIERLLREDSIQGIRLSPGNEPWLDAKPTVAIGMAAEALGVPVIVQIRPGQYDRFARLAASCRNTVFALDHIGGAALTGESAGEFSRLLALSMHPNICVKTSHLYGLDRSPEEEAAIPAALERLRKAFGAERLMFGSNWPLVRSFGGLKRCVDGFCEAISGFTAEEQRLVLGGTARKLYRWERDG